MAQSNARRSAALAGRTHEGAPALAEAPIAALQRVINAHMLFEDTFYMDGQSNADVLTAAVARAAAHDPAATRQVIVDARSVHNIRHASLMGAVAYARTVGGGADAIALYMDVIQRADEMAELIAMSMRGTHQHGKPIKVPSAVRQAIKRTFESDKFDAYQYGKYQGKGKSVTLRDAAILSHASSDLQPLVRQIIDGTLAAPDTWEVGLSTGGDKCETFTRLLTENKLGAMALLRNLRGMREANVNTALIGEAMRRANWSRVLPFRFMSAALYAPWAAPMLDDAFRKAVSGSTYLRGRTAVLLDTSGSMSSPISKKSTVRAYQAGATLAAAVNGDHVDLYQWADRTKQMMNWRSLSTAMGIRTGEVGIGTYSAQAVQHALDNGPYDRIIIISDMQFAEAGTRRYGSARVPVLPSGVRGYTINMSPYGNAGLMVGNWTHLTGFSDSILKWIATNESVS